MIACLISRRYSKRPVPVWTVNIFVGDYWNLWYWVVSTRSFGPCGLCLGLWIGIVLQRPADLIRLASEEFGDQIIASHTRYVLSAHPKKKKRSVLRALGSRVCGEECRRVGRIVMLQLIGLQAIQS